MLGEFHRAHIGSTIKMHRRQAGGVPESPGGGRLAVPWEEVHRARTSSWQAHMKLEP